MKKLINRLLLIRGRKRIILLSIPLILIVFMIAAMFDRQRPETVIVQRQDVRSYYTEVGRISFGEPYTLVSEVGGAVNALYKQVNSVVKEGELVAVIDSSEYSHQKKLLESQISGIEAQLRKWELGQVMTEAPGEYISGLEQEARRLRLALEAERSALSAAEVLYQSGDIAKTEYERQKAAFAAAEAASSQAERRASESKKALERLEEQGLSRENISSAFFEADRMQLTSQLGIAEAQLSHAEEQIGKCRIISRLSGTITELPIADKSAVNTGEAILTIRPDGEACCEAELLTSVAPAIKVGSPASIRLDLRGADENYTGIVSEVYDYARKQTSALGMDEYRVKVKVRIEDEGSELLSLRNGYGVSIEFLTYDEKDVLTVPSSSVFLEKNQYYVYGYNKGRAEKKEIRLLHEGTEISVIGEGLSEGDRVIKDVETYTP